MGFAQTAAYFDARAKTARDPMDAERFAEVAGFYRRLARITPGFPPHVNGARRWKSRAEECRTIAEHLTDPLCRVQMMRLADTYDGLSTAAE